MLNDRLLFYEGQCLAAAAPMDTDISLLQAFNFTEEVVA